MWVLTSNRVENYFIGKGLWEHSFSWIISFCVIIFYLRITLIVLKYKKRGIQIFWATNFLPRIRLCSGKFASDVEFPLANYSWGYKDTSMSQGIVNLPWIRWAYIKCQLTLKAKQINQEQQKDESRWGLGLNPFHMGPFGLSSI